MTLTVYADFSDPLSYLAHQRVARLGAPVDWRAVVARPLGPVTGTRVAPADAEAWTQTLARLALPGERLPVLPQALPHPGALTSAFAEAVDDGAQDALRAAAMAALWEDGGGLPDVTAVKRLVAAVMNPPATDVLPRLPRTPLLELGCVDPTVPVRRSGGTVSLHGGPVTTRAQHRLDAWRDGWRLRSHAALPLVVTDLGEALPGERGLAYLAGLLPVRPDAAFVTAA